MAKGEILIYNNVKYIDVTPIMTSNTTPSPYVCEGNADVDKTEYMIFDGNVETYYRSDINFTTGYFQIYLGEPVILEAYSLMVNKYANDNWTMKSWEFLGSNNGVDWTPLHSVTDKTSWTANEVCMYEFNNSTAYSYYRIYCSAKNGGNSISADEMKLYTKEKSKLHFHKILEDNLPSNPILNGDDNIYFTEKGNIYMLAKNGFLKRMGSNDNSTELNNGNEILFDGLISSTGEYILSHPIYHFKYLYLTGASINYKNNFTTENSILLNVADLRYDENINAYNLLLCTENEEVRQIFFTFKDYNTIVITRLQKYNADNSVVIRKIIGIY